MFEDRTYENLLQEMLDEVPDYIDKRQGSVVFDALSPSAAKLAQAYIDLKSIAEIANPEKAMNEWLDLKGRDLGVTRNLAVYAEREIIYQGTAPNSGSRFLEPISGLYYALNNESHLVCETVGIIGNSPMSGVALVPVEDLPNTTSLALGEVIVAGSEKEDNDPYRARIQQKFNGPEANCNLAQIIKWCSDVEGVKVRSVQSLWNGDTSVKAVLISTQGLPLSSDLVTEVQNYIDPPDNQGRHGTGEGMADIGVVFTAVSATSMSININLSNVQISEGCTQENVISAIESSLTTYLMNKALNKVDLLKYNEVFALITDISIISDFTNLKVNDGTTNITIPSDKVAIKGVITFE